MFWKRKPKPIYVPMGLFYRLYSYMKAHPLEPLMSELPTENEPVHGRIKHIGQEPDVVLRLSPKAAEQFIQASSDYLKELKTDEVVSR